MKENAAKHYSVPWPVSDDFSDYPTILGVGTATASQKYTQHEVVELFGIEDQRKRAIFTNSAINERGLTLPEQAEHVETQAELIAKHKRQAVTMGAEALKNCLDKIGATIDDIEFLCCVTSTGFLAPGVSALICQHLSIPINCQRLDVVGMGCHAGLNGLNAVSRWSKDNPEKLAILLCVEVCSAAYVMDETIQSTVVNSLFGDGSSAAALMRSKDSELVYAKPKIKKFSSFLLPNSLDVMKYSWDDEHGKFSFYLSKDVPYLIGRQIETIVGKLLDELPVKQSEIDHWIIHSGGKKVIDSIKINLGLSPYDVRHTSSVLGDYGNVSSGSFLFSLERLLAEGVIKSGDKGVMITMGPGVTIESAYIEF
ncbi:3,5-dihydroxyphenylacetyl-CoA synthase DpgA [Pseudoalteromonas umbrosa]|uniref:3,5-dihydroxyphenylacetyl-CoA synthase DpgA n=1 Tax=Pseudoalteromonas umbrosa TaxID=3048489 RepID=UPI0024C3B35D|nr:3,5-dihydroxyphenylacetyl-CoA synthase DpgA [Pseudoalteromonas sp. B95]MDK1288838.1 type III polyketide synthase [Pseudoalteromonas sp. B95]